MIDLMNCTSRALRRHMARAGTNGRRNARRVTPGDVGTVLRKRREDTREAAVLDFIQR